MTTEVIGYLVVEGDKYITWYKGEAFDWLCDKWQDVFYQLQSCKIGSTTIGSLYNDFSGNVSYASSTPVKQIQSLKDRFLSDTSHTYADVVQPRLHYCTRYNQRAPVVYEHELFFVVRFGGTYKLIAKVKDIVDIVYLQTPSDMVEMSKEVSINSPAALETLPALVRELESVDAQLQSFHSEEQQIADMSHEGLSELKTQLEKIEQEIEKKKSELLSQLQAKQEELNTEKRKMEIQIEKLEAQIYSIRCYTGEVIDFVKIRDGKRLSQNDSLVVYQKLRYLDVEFGKLAALCGRYHEEDLTIFEELLKSDDTIFDIFCPCTKGVSIAKVSKDGRIYGQHSIFLNMLQAYQVEHGDMLCILIRDGEQLYMGWADPDKITVRDDLFYVPSTPSIIHEEDVDKSRNSSKEDILSRYFIFNILEGCLKNPSPIIHLPAYCSFFHPCSEIVFSASDNWIESFNYPSFADILKRANEVVKVGDDLLSLQTLYTGSTQDYRGTDKRYNCSRARGTHIQDCCLYTMNLIQVESQSAIYEYKGRKYVEVFNSTEEHNSILEIAYQRFKERIKDKEIIIDDISIVPKYAYYVSICKDDSKYVWTEDGDMKKRERNYCANVRVYEDEYVNIQVINSTWVKYWMDTEHIGCLDIGNAEVNFSYVVKYLSRMLKVITDREKDELSLLKNAGFDENMHPDWRIKLSEYKISTGRHVLKPRWAKHFVNQMQSL